jgi:hypothetical protein
MLSCSMTQVGSTSQGPVVAQPAMREIVDSVQDWKYLL